MPNTKISALPFKHVLAGEDIIPIVDTQFGSVNYVNKKTTVTDFLELARVYVDAQILEINPVLSVNGQTGNAALSLSQLDDVIIAAPAIDEFLVYSSSASAWTNQSFQSIDMVFDCGDF
jgi:hypothetical protein